MDVFFVTTAAKSPHNTASASAEWVDPIVLQLQASAQSVADAAAVGDVNEQEEEFVPPTSEELMAE